MNLLIPHGFEANYVVGFARGLSANGVAFVVASSDEIEDRLRLYGIAQENIRGSGDVSRSSMAKGINLFRYYFLLLRMIFRYRGATIHFIGLLNSSFILVDGIILPLWIRMWSGRYVHTVHNVLPHSRQDSGFFRSMYQWIYQFPNILIAHSKGVAQELSRDYNVAPDRVIVISIGLNEEVPNKELSQSEARRRLDLPASGAIALFFGKIEPYKGVDILAEAWGLVRSKSANLYIVGQCPDSIYARKVREDIARSKGSASIHWREGFVANDLVGAWLAASDVVVMPYRSIYQSGVVLLCLQFGIPIVATNVGSLPDFIDPSRGIIAKANGSAGVAQALDEFLTNPGRFSRMDIMRGAASFNWKTQCLAIKHLYR